MLSTQLNLNYVRIGTNFAAFPPKREQKAIAEYLDAKEQEALSITTGIEAQTATLIDYRKWLIHECVTGQRRVTAADVTLARRDEAEFMSHADEREIRPSPERQTALARIHQK